MSADLRSTYKITAAVAALLAAVLSAVACAAYTHQHSAAAAEHIFLPASAQAVAPAAAEFRSLPEGAQGARVRGEVEEAKANLAKDGRYRCCVRPSCNECLLKRGECHCREVAAKKGPCCGECTEAWIEGHGAIEGIDALDLLRRKLGMLNEPADKPHGR
jgi:hypothetical protein